MSCGFSVSFPVSLDLLDPIGSVVNWNASAARTMMAVPKTAMHEDDLFQPWKHKVRLAGKIVAMESKAKAETVNHRADNLFGAGVLCFHRTHDSASEIGIFH